MDESTFSGTHQTRMAQLGRDMASRAERDASVIVERVRERSGARQAAKTRKSAHTRERILNAASEIISERGSVNFQMSEVAQRCGMSKGALYYYFSDREAIVSQLFDAGVDELVAMLQEVSDSAETAEAALTAMARVFIEYLLSSEAATSALVSGVMSGRSGVFPYVESRYSDILALVESQFVRAKQEGIIRADIDTRLVASTSCGAYILTALDQMGREGHPTAEELADHLTSLVMFGISA